MKPTTPTPDTKTPWEYYDYDNAMYRRPGPQTAVTDVLVDGKWTPYKGRDRTAPHYYGNRVEKDPAK